MHKNGCAQHAAHTSASHSTERATRARARAACACNTHLSPAQSCAVSATESKQSQSLLCQLFPESARPSELHLFLVPRVELDVPHEKHSSFGVPKHGVINSIRMETQHTVTSKLCRRMRPKPRFQQFCLCHRRSQCSS